MTTPIKHLSELRKQLLDAESTYKRADSSLDSSPLQVIVAKEDLKIARYNYALACKAYVEVNVFGNFIEEEVEA